MPNLTKFDGSDLSLHLDTADSIVNKKYLANLNQCEVIPASEDIKNVELNKISRFYKLEQFVFDRSEDTRDKLVSVFQAVASVEASLVVIIDSKKDKINYYIGVKNFSGNLSQAHDVLYKSLSGNFPGIVFSKYENMQDKAAITLNKKDLIELEQDIFERSKQTSQNKSISVITGVAGIRAEKSSEQKFIQGLERVIDF